MAKKLKFEIVVEDKATSDINKIQREVDELTKKLNKSGDAAANTGPSYKKMAGAIAIGTLAARGLSMAMQEGIQFLQSSVTAFNNYQSAMLGLSSVAAAFGESQNEAKDAAQNLARDGLMPVTQAGEGLKNLLASGFNLEESINLMNAFKDASAFNRQGTLKFGEAIVGATQGIKNQNSIMVDNVGITKNLTMIMKEQGLAVTDLQYVTTDASVRQKLYNGLLEEASIFSGDAALAADTLQGKMEALDTSMYNLNVTVGEVLSPVMEMFIDGMIIGADDMSTKTQKAMQFIQVAMLDLTSAIAIAGSAIINTFKAIGNVIVWEMAAAGKALMGDHAGAIEAHKKAFNSIGDSFKQFNIDRTSMMELTQLKIDKIVKGGFQNQKGAMDRSTNAISKNADKIAKEMERLEKKMATVQKNIAKETSNFARRMENATFSFHRNLTDLVQRHRTAIKDLKTDISDLNAEFAEGNSERLEDHDDKVTKINKQYDKETKTLKENLSRRLADSHDSDKQLVSFFQKQIDEKELAREEELAEEDKQFKKESEKTKSAYNKSLALLNEKLTVEENIQKKHQADFDAIKDQAVEDDITRLKTSFEREMVQIKTQHDERMVELRKQQEEILAVKAASTTGEARAVTSASSSRSVDYTRAPAAAPKTPSGVKTPPGQIMTPAPNMSVAPGVNIIQTNNNYSQIDYDTQFKKLGWLMAFR